MKGLTMKLSRIGYAVLAIAIPSTGFALSIDDITDKSKPVWTDLSISASHQYLLGTLFWAPPRVIFAA